MRRFLIFMLCFSMVFCVSFCPRSASAFAAPVLRIVAGSTAEKVMIGIAEKAGVKYATKTAMEKARERWNMELYEELMAQTTPVEVKQRLETFSRAINSADVIPIPSRPGFGKVVLDTALFLTGLDIVFEAYNVFKTAYEKQKFADGLSNAMAEGSYVRVFPGYSLQPYSKGTHYGIPYTDWRLVNDSNPSKSIDVLGGYGNVDTYPFDWYYEITNNQDTYCYVTLHYNYKHPEYGVRIGVETGIFVPKQIGHLNDPFISAIPVTETDVPSITGVPRPLQPLATPGLDPVPNVKGLPDKVEIVVPIDQPYPDPGSEPLNSPDDLLRPNPDPNPDPDPNGDLNGDPKPSPDSPNLNPFNLPVEALAGLLCILKAVCLYLIRLFRFIVSIPTAAPVSINNPAFEWFRSAKIVGVQIYTVISSLASVGLSVMVYKAIRRVFP